MLLLRVAGQIGSLVMSRDISSSLVPQCCCLFSSANSNRDLMASLLLLLYRCQNVCCVLYPILILIPSFFLLFFFFFSIKKSGQISQSLNEFERVMEYYYSSRVESLDTAAAVALSSFFFHQH